MISEEYEGSLPVDERTGIDEYAARVVPTIERFVGELQAIGLAPWTRSADYPTSRFSRGQSASGMPLIDMHYNAISTGPLDAGRVIRAGDRILTAAGFNTATVAQQGNGAVRLLWRDEPNGGFVWVTIVPGSHTGLTAASGVRPLVTAGSRSGW